MKTAGLVILIVLAVILLLVLLLCGFAFNQIIWRKTLSLPRFIEKMIAGNAMPDCYDADAEKAQSVFCALPLESVTLSAPDGAKLRGKVLVPEKSNGKLILACHGARSSGIGEFCFIGPYLYKQGYTLVMPDHRGCGESDGKFMGYGTHESKDAFLWLDYAKSRFPGLAVFLYGVSMGGATVLMMSRNLSDPAVQGIVADCPYTSAWDEFAYQLKTSFHLPAFPALYVCDLFCRVFCRYKMKDASPLEAVKQAKKPVLFIHGEKDDFVPTYMQEILYGACPVLKRKLTVNDAVHARSYYANHKVYENAFEGFIETCMEQTV